MVSISKMFTKVANNQGLALHRVEWYVGISEQPLCIQFASCTFFMYSLIVPFDF